MSFAKKTWKDRITEYPTRRTLTKTDGSTELVTVARSEGSVSQEGDAFDASNMNDLENRIESEFNTLNGNLTDDSTGIGFRFGVDANGNYGYIKDGADTVTPFRNGGLELEYGTSGQTTSYYTEDKSGFSGNWTFTGTYIFANADAARLIRNGAKIAVMACEHYYGLASATGGWKTVASEASATVDGDIVTIVTKRTEAFNVIPNYSMVYYIKFLIA